MYSYGDCFYIDSSLVIDHTMKSLGVTCFKTYFTLRDEPYFASSKPTKNISSDSHSDLENRILISLSSLKNYCAFQHFQETKSVKPEAVYWNLNKSWDPVLLVDDNDKLVSGCLTNRIVKNSSRSITIFIDGKKYFIPKNATFIICDIFTIPNHVLDCLGEFNLIIIDPPWPNKSVNRSKSFETVLLEQLLKFEFNRFLTAGGLVLLWITNNARLHQFIFDVLLPKWNLAPVCGFFWVKLTQLGKPIIKLNSTHRKPYEQLLLLKNSCSHTFKLGRDKLNLEKVIFSIAPNNHSRKPNLLPLIKSYFPSKTKILEFFARSLNPDWVSIGNDTIYYQSSQFFENIIV